MNKLEAEEFVKDLKEDDRADLIMYLAECFNYRVIDCGTDITYFLSTGTDDPYERLNLFLQGQGWDLECYSPLEISHRESGSRATGIAAEMTIEALEEEAGVGEYH